MSDYRFDSIYQPVEGCIVSYKPFYEPLLFNELNSRCKGIKLCNRADTSAAFLVADFLTVLEEIEKDAFVFLQHIHPYQKSSPVNGTDADLSVYVSMLEELFPYLMQEDRLTCQCRIDTAVPFSYSNQDLTKCLSEQLKTKGFCVDPAAADTVVSLTVYRDMAYLGISRLEHNVSDWTGGIRFFSKSDGVICRAEFKIEEAFRVFGITVEEGMAALDLGAAPGGWTHFLSKQGVNVDAVDPANLEDEVKKAKNVRHYKMLAQEFAEKYKEKRYDIIVNDMKMDTNESIDILCEMSSQLKPDGCCILTLKLPKTNIQKRINVARQVLARKFETVQIRQLYFNRSEVTVFARKFRSKTESEE